MKKMYFYGISEVRTHFAMNDPEGMRLWSELKRMGEVEEAAEEMIKEFEDAHFDEAPAEYYDASDKAHEEWKKAFDAFDEAVTKWIQEHSNEIEFVSAY